MKFQKMKESISLSFFLFSRPKIAWRSLDFRLFAFIHVVFGLVFLGGVLVGSHVCVFRHGVRHLRLAMQSQSVLKLRFNLHLVYLKKKNARCLKLPSTHNMTKATLQPILIKQICKFSISLTIFILNSSFLRFSGHSLR